MGKLRFVSSVGLSLVLLLAIQVPAFATTAETPSSPGNVVIGVDYSDPANQDPAAHRLFEYTDFFTRSVTIRTGDSLTFRTAPGAFHIVAVAKSDQVARATYPVGTPDFGDTPAIGTGKPKIIIGDSTNFPIVDGNLKTGGGFVQLPPNSPPTCGIVAMGEKACSFTGGNDVESAGPIPGFNPTTGAPAAVDWTIVVNAKPGRYNYFCFIHPGMTGSFLVVAKNDQRALRTSGWNSDDHLTTQSEIDWKSKMQFAQDRHSALAAEKAANVLHWTGGAPGSRTYQVDVGISAANNHVAVDEMLPNKPIDLTPGDKVTYLWRDGHNVHTVGISSDESLLPPPFVPDDPPEFVGDPGNAPSGTALVSPSSVVDAGLRVGRDYGVRPSSQRWSIKTNGSTAKGTYQFMCTVHDFMVGQLVVQ